MISTQFLRGIRGPVGSGKSVTCCWDLMTHAFAQPPSPIDKKRRFHGTIIRNTNPQLKTTTMKTWKMQFPEERFGPINMSPPYSQIVTGKDFEFEFLFLSADREDDIRKLLSLDTTMIWVNEAREMRKGLIDIITTRARRFPPKEHGGPPTTGVIMDTNAPEDNHWWPIIAGDTPLPPFISPEEAALLVRPDNWQFFNQPGAMTEIKDGKIVRGYEINPDAENLQNLPDDYYQNSIQGKRKSWINVYVLNRLGTVIEGKPCYENFNKEIHVSAVPLEPIKGLPIRVGFDWGLTPAAIFAQQLHDGRYRVLAELCMTEMGAKRFARVVRQFVLNAYPGYPLLMHGDPTGDNRRDTDEETVFRVVRAEGLNVAPAPTNDVTIRLETGDEMFGRIINGEPAVLIDPSCTTFTYGAEVGYQFPRISTASEVYEDSPAKNQYSHVHDAWQALLLGAGEHKRVLQRHANGPGSVMARKRTNVLRRERDGRRSRRERRYSV